MTEGDVLDALHRVMHAEMKRDPVELQMIRGINTDIGKVTVTPALPFKEIPIRDDLIL